MKKWLLLKITENIYYRNKVFQNNQKQNKGETIEVNASFV